MPINMHSSHPLEFTTMSEVFDHFSAIMRTAQVPQWIMGCKLLEVDAMLPTKAYAGDLGYDLYALEDVTLTPGQVTKVRTGIAVSFPQGYGALIRDRSSVATKQGVFVVAGVIDQSYTGEIIVAFQNPKDAAVFFKKHDKIAQMILTPVVNAEIVIVDDLGSSDRGTSGFGSSGR